MWSTSRSGERIKRWIRSYPSQHPCLRQLQSAEKLHSKLATSASNVLRFTLSDWRDVAARRRLRRAISLWGKPLPSLQITGRPESPLYLCLFTPMIEVSDSAENSSRVSCKKLTTLYSHTCLALAPSCFCAARGLHPVRIRALSLSLHHGSPRKDRGQAHALQRV